MGKSYKLVPVEGNDEINNVVESVENLFDETVNWYQNSLRPKRFLSKAFRILGILSFAFGSSLPLLAYLNLNFFQPNLGYVAFALAGLLYTFDKLLGYSSGWMRYISTKLELEATWFQFEQRWAILVLGFSKDCEETEKVSICDLYDALYDFKIEIQGIVEEETKQWIAEFKSNLAEFEKLVKSKTAELKPGSAFIEVKDADKIGEIEMNLAGKTISLQDKNGYLFKNLKPGDYQLTVTGKKDGASVNRTQTVTVTPGQMTKTSIEL